MYTHAKKCNKNLFINNRKKYNNNCTKLQNQLLIPTGKYNYYSLLFIFPKRSGYY